MPKRSRKPSSDPNTSAFQIVQQATSQPSTAPKGKNPAAVALGRLGGLKGGRARADSLSAKRKRQIARKAARTRWEGSK